MDNKLSHTVAEDLLPSYIDQLTSPKTTILMEEHIRQCPLCQDKLKAMQENALQPDPSRHLSEKIKEDSWLKKINRRHKRMICMLTILILCCAGLGYWGYTRSQKRLIPVSQIEWNLIPTQNLNPDAPKDAASLHLYLNGTYAYLNKIRIGEVSTIQKGDVLDVEVYEETGTDHKYISVSEKELNLKNIRLITLNSQDIWLDGISLTNGTGDLARSMAAEHLAMLPKFLTSEYLAQIIAGDSGEQLNQYLNLSWLLGRFSVQAKSLGSEQTVENQSDAAGNPAESSDPAAGLTSPMELTFKFEEAGSQIAVQSRLHPDQTPVLHQDVVELLKKNARLLMALNPAIHKISWLFPAAAGYDSLQETYERRNLEVPQILSADQLAEQPDSQRLLAVWDLVSQLDLQDILNTYLYPSDAMLLSRSKAGFNMNTRTDNTFSALWDLCRTGETLTFSSSIAIDARDPLYIDLPFTDEQEKEIQQEEQSPEGSNLMLCFEINGTTLSTPYQPRSCYILCENSNYESAAINSDRYELKIIPFFLSWS